MRVRTEGYEAPKEQSDVSTGETGVAFEEEQDIGYHNRYGAEEETNGPLDEKRDMGYHGRFLKA